MLLEKGPHKIVKLIETFHSQIKKPMWRSLLSNRNLLGTSGEMGGLGDPESHAASDYMSILKPR